MSKMRALSSVVLLAAKSAPMRAMASSRTVEAGAGGLATAAGFGPCGRGGGAVDGGGGAVCAGSESDSRNGFQDSGFAGRGRGGRSTFDAAFVWTSVISSCCCARCSSSSSSRRCEDALWLVLSSTSAILGRGSGLPGG